MSLRTHLALLPGSGLLILAPALTAPQADDAQALLTVGDPAAGGGLIAGIDLPSMSDLGDWAARVTTDQGAFEDNSYVVVNGDVVLREGDTLANGEVVGAVLSLDLSSDGGTAWIHRVDPGTPGAETVLYIDGVERRRSGVMLSGPGFPANTRLTRLQRVSYDAPLALLLASVSVNSQTEIDILVVADLSAPGPPVLQAVAREGETPAALPGPIAFFYEPLDIASDGTFIAPTSFDVGGTLRYAFASDQGWRAVDGTPVGGSGDVWSHFFNVESACAAGGRYVISGQVETPTGELEGVVVGPSGLLAREGQPLPADPSESASFFTSAFVGMSSSGAAAFEIPLPGFDDVLVYDGDIVLRESTDTISGGAIGSRVVSNGSIAVGSDGRELLFVSTDAAGQNVLALLETEVGVPGPGCVAAPNSTGAIGRTRGLGTGIAAANDLVFESVDLPPLQFTLLITSRTPGFTPGLAGGPGNLCLGGTLGRILGTLAPADASGTVVTPVDLTALPDGSVAVAAQPGETWYFQRWHRDDIGAGPTSNLSTSVEVTLR